MSYSSLSQAMERIKGAPQDSPIAVFSCDKEGCVETVFYSTAYTHIMVQDRAHDLIGVFDETMDREKVKDKIRTEMYPRPFRAGIF